MIATFKSQELVTIHERACEQTVASAVHPSKPQMRQPIWHHAHVHGIWKRVTDFAITMLSPFPLDWLVERLCCFLERKLPAAVYRTRHIISYFRSTYFLGIFHYHQWKVPWHQWKVPWKSVEIGVLPWKIPWKFVKVDVLLWKLVEAVMEIHGCFRCRWEWTLPLLPSIAAFTNIPWMLPLASIHPFVLPPVSTSITNFQLLPQDFYKGSPASVRSCTCVKAGLLPSSMEVAGSFHGSCWKLPWK